MADNDLKDVYFYLVSLTSLGRMQKEGEIHDDHTRVTKVITEQLHGTCKLYKVPGPYDFISEVKDIDGDGAIRVQREIELKGFAKAILLPGDPRGK